MNTNMTGFRWFSKSFASSIVLETKVASALEGLRLLRPKHKDAKNFKKHLNPDMLVFIG